MCLLLWIAVLYLKSRYIVVVDALFVLCFFVCLLLVVFSVCGAVMACLHCFVCFELF